MVHDSSLKGFGALDIWITKLGQPCKISDRKWFVTIWHCDGSLLEWCGKKYIVVPAPCGHVSITIPPGCYYISAVWSYKELPNENYQANHFTHGAIVELCCNERQCVKLYNPKIHKCGKILMEAAKNLVGRGNNTGFVDPDDTVNNPGGNLEIQQAEADNVVNVLNQFLGRLDPNPGILFEVDENINLDAQVEAQTLIGDKLC